MLGKRRNTEVNKTRSLPLRNIKCCWGDEEIHERLYNKKKGKNKAVWLIVKKKGGERTGEEKSSGNTDVTEIAKYYAGPNYKKRDTEKAQIRNVQLF